MIYNKTCLFSATAGTNSITLSEPLSAFERYVVKVNPGVYWESVCTADRTVQRYNRYGSYNNDGYMEWPANWVISNGTKSMSCNRFQLLYQASTAAPRLFGWNNTASNIKNIMEVWGINRKDYTTAEGEGRPEGDWKTYNETLLWSGTDYANQSHITLNNRAVGYERLKVGVGSFGESTNIYDVDAPQSYTSWLPLRSYWGTTTGSFYLSMHRYQWDNETSGLSAVSGKTWQLGTGSANPYSTTGNYTATDTYIRRPVWAIWGINEKDKYKLIPGSMTGGTISANRNSGYEHDITTITGVPAGDEWKCSAINITGAELTGNDFMFTNSNVSAQAEFEHSRELTLENGDHGVLSADAMTGFSGDVVTVDATTDEGWYFTGLNVTGAVATGNKFTFIGNDVTAEGLYTDEGFPITYLSDSHVHLAGDQYYIPGSEGISLQSSYDTYYRISGYDITGGSLVNGKLVATGPCTIKAVEKVNKFTASGKFNLVSNGAYAHGRGASAYTVSYAYYTGGSNVPAAYYNKTLTSYDGPKQSACNSSWYPTGSISGYKFSGITVVTLTSTYTGNNLNVNLRNSANNSIGNTFNQNDVRGVTVTSTGTTTTLGQVYRSAFFWKWTTTASVNHIQSIGSNLWTATGIAP